jgi:hypothetical protein
MTKTILLVTTALILSGNCFAADLPTLSVRTSPGYATVGPNRDLQTLWDGGIHTLYDQDAGSNGLGIVSQYFGSPTGYDSEGADDFQIPGDTVWVLHEVDVKGAYSNGPGPVDSFNVWFYRGNKKTNLPGQPKIFCGNLKYTVINGVFKIPLQGCAGHDLRDKQLNPFEYWVSVEANMQFPVGGEWLWVTNNVQAFHPSAWQNPGGGFGTGCTMWTTTTKCMVEGEGPDFAFAIKGVARGGGATSHSGVVIGP